VVDLDNVVVRVEASRELSSIRSRWGSSQFTHLGGNDIDALLSVLSTSTHGKVGVKGRELLGLVSLGDNTEVVRVIKEVVVKCEVTAGPLASVTNKKSKRSLIRNVRRDDIDTSVLHGVPSLLSDSLGGLFELLLRSLTVPVGLDNLSISILFLARSFLDGNKWGEKYD